MRQSFSVQLIRRILLLSFATLIVSPLVRAQVAFVQVNSAVPQSTAVSSVSVAFTAAQTAGNLNVVVVGWNDTTSSVASLTDTAGNSYIRAVGPTLGTDLSQSIYYAKNIVGATAGANSVTVAFSPAAAYPDIRILEYRGIDTTNPVDVTTGASGNSATSSTAAVTTTNANDLLVGANMVFTSTTGAGTSYTQRIITFPDGDIAEDRVVTATGSYKATAPMTTAAPWVIQMVAFRAAGGGGAPDTTPPTAPGSLAATAVSASQINLTWTASTDNVGVTGYRVERCQGSGCTTFAQIATPTAASYSDPGLTAGTSYSYRVRANDAAGNLSGYSNTATATTPAPDTTPPTPPSNLAANPVSTTQINLSWTASTDNVGVTGYRVERCQGAACSNFAQIATPTTTTYNDTGRTASTSYSYQVRATDAAGNLGGYSNIASATTLAPPPDTTPPTVSITAPAQNATVLGVVTVSANASDNVGVVGVQFKVDGVNIGSEDTTSPYSISWDSSGVTPGVMHTLTAVARDAANNTATSTGIKVTVQSAATLGQWTGPFTWPMVAVHTMLMPNGKLLIIDGQEFGQATQVWDPAANTFTSVPAPINLFCTGHVSMADGRILVLGGHSDAHVGLNGTSIFDPQSQTWTVGTPMFDPRWYPTATALPDGRVIVTAGETNCDGCDVPTPDIYNPSTNSWTRLNNASLVFSYYPHSFVLSDGRMLVSSTTETPIISRVLNINTQTWTAVGSTALDGGSAVMYRPGKILKTGTSVNPDAALKNSFPTAYVLDMNQTSPAWRQVPSMSFARTYHTMVLLPDGNVFVEGGGTTSAPLDASTAVFQAEIWSPTTETFATVASMATPRLYHNTSLLLPDGRVLVAGGGRFNCCTVPTDRLNAEIYMPPYLFKGARPTVTSAPSTLPYSQTFFIQTPNAAQIGSVVLMRIGAVTHSFDQSQSYVPLTFQAVSGGLNVQAPANTNLAPPGYYMLFIVNTSGVPAVAPIVKLPVTSGGGQPPSAPSNLAATGGVGSIGLTWSASSGPNGISSYNVHRGTAPGVVPSQANRIAQPTGTSFTDTSFPASGTYYYVVTAQDSFGNISGPSNEAVATASADTTPPIAPSNLVATAASNSQINLTWTASTDDVGVTGYKVERCQGAGCSNFVQVAAPTGVTFGDTGLVSTTTYNYRVRATDGAGNLSPYSNSSSATTTSTPPAPPAFVQVNSAVPQSTAVSSVPVTFTAAQTAGNLNVVVVGWNDTTATVTSLTDTAGNIYVRAVGPTLGTDLSESIYYAKNIAGAAAGVNRVTVAFSPAAAYPDIRILEYSGIDPVNSVDVTVAAAGNSASSNSGAVTTLNPNDLLFGANMVFTSTTGAGTGFVNRIITFPDGDIAEDRVVTLTGSYSAVGPMTAPAPWIMQLVAFRAAGSPAPQAQAKESGPAVQ